MVILFNINLSLDNEFGLEDWDHYFQLAVNKTTTEMEQRIGKNLLSISTRHHDHHHHQVVVDTSSKKRPSPVCRPSFGSKNRTNITRIYMAHMRKAGGSTLRMYLNGVAEQYGLQLDVNEGGRFEYPGTHPTTLYVTHLRDPYERAISHFKYDQRWDCGQQLTKPGFIPTYENAHYYNLTRWIDEKGVLQRDAKCSTRFLWECSTNCYIRWLNHPIGTCHPESFQVNSSLYHKALEQAYQYNVIIDMNRLFGDESYGRDLESFFSEKGLLGLKGHPYCDVQSKLANQQFPLIVDNDTRSLLVERNRPDYDLYNALVTCPGGIEFPSTGIENYTSSK
jgi:hypothetical protein